MDHARKIGKTETPFVWTQKPSPPSSICDRAAPLEDDEVNVEDRRLVNWRKWLENREKNYERIAKYTGRERKDLLMTRDDYHQTFDTRNLAEDAFVSDLSTADKYRGDPAFWITPVFLPKRGNPELPDIAVTLTKKQLNAKTEVEKFGVPELIKREKGLPIFAQQSLTNEHATRQRTENRPRDHETSLSRKIEIPRSHVPEISQLSIKGQKVGSKLSKKVSKTSAVTMESKTSRIDRHPGQRELDELGDSVILIVQNREMKYVENLSKRAFDQFSFSLVFDSLDFSLCRREIRLENTGNWAITYRWRRGSEASRLIPTKPNSVKFFFNKNKELVLPGQVVEIPVWFRSRDPGLAMEIWNLTTEPPVSSEPLVFRFWGSATFSPSRDSTEDLQDTLVHFPNPDSVERYLERRIRDAEVYEIVESIIKAVPSSKDASVPYSSLFLESDIFRAKNPDHFYHSHLIRNLRKIYHDATGDESWNLSLNDLRSVLMRMENSTVRDEMIIRFNEACRHSLKPNLNLSTDNSKISTVYNTLCTFFNKFEEESDRSADTCAGMEIFEAKITGEAPGDASKSTSVASSRISLVTPRRKTRKGSRFGQSRTTSGTSISTANRSVVESVDKSIASNFRNEVFRVRIREMLSSAILEICAIVDTTNKLKSREI